MLDYTLEGPKWTTPVVTWSFATAGNPAFTNPIAAAYQNTIAAAAATWNAVSNVQLQQVAPGTAGADIVVGWGSFSGAQVGETDYSYALGSAEAFLPGMTIRIEDPALLPIAPTPGATFQGTSTTLLGIAQHEFGHALGLGLSSDPNAAMYLYVGPNNATLDASDVAGIDALYGSRSTTVAAAQSAAPGASTTVTAPLPGTIALGANEIGVYRFFDAKHGTEFLTGSASEANAIIGSNSGLTYEGLAMAGVAPGAGDAHAASVYRFFDMNTGTHFFTASAAEEATIAATRSDLVLEQTSFYEHATQQAGDAAVYRFFDTANGTHFFTADSSERASVIATRPDMTYEGVAFYAPSLA